VNERVTYITRIRKMATQCAEIFVSTVNNG